MFDNIGGKVKGLAKFICWAGIISSIIVAIAIWVIPIEETSYNSYYGYTTTKKVKNPTGLRDGFTVLISGCLGSWVGSWVTYAVGETAENAEVSCAEIAELQNTLERTQNELKQAQTQIDQKLTDISNTLRSKDSTKNPSSNEEKKGDKEWAYDSNDQDYVICPQCGIRISLYSIYMKKACPTCGCVWRPIKP